jgi:hypothetical protein
VKEKGIEGEKRRGRNKERDLRVGDREGKDEMLRE